MKLKHLIQGYNFNKVSAKVIEETNSYAGVIKFYNDKHINASYMLNEEKFVEALVIFSNCICEKRTIDAQIKHSTNILIVISQSIQLIGNTTKEEASKIIKALGLINSRTIKHKAVKFLEYIYEVDIIEGLLKFSIINLKIKDEIKKEKAPAKNLEHKRS